MTVKVAVLPIKENDATQALRKAVELVGGVDGLNTADRNVTIKVGIFDPRSRHHSRTEVVQALINVFDQAPKVYLAESDNYCGKALDRLNCYKDLFSGRVEPLSLSEGPDMRRTLVAGEEMDLSGALFKPNVLISTHILRTFNRGTILKNLFGCTPMVQKARFHKNEIFAPQLADIYEAAGGIDLAVMDGTFLFHNATEKNVRLDVLIVGRDAVAVETVGALIAGLKPEKSAVIPEFVRRGLGVGNRSEIEIVGISEEEFAGLLKARKELKKVIEAAPRSPGISGSIDLLTEEGWLDQFHTAAEVSAELQQRGVKNATKAMVETTLKRRVGKTLEQSKANGSGRGGSVYRRKQG